MNIYRLNLEKHMSINRFRVVIVLFSFITSFAASSHDFWLQADDYVNKKGSQTNIKFKVGHHDDVEDWDLQWRRVVSIRSYHERGVSDLASSLMPNQAFVSGRVTADFPNEGTYVIGFESYHSISELPAEKFNNYARNEGLSLVLEARQNKDQTSGREIYSRKAKAIIQVGESLSNNATKPIGHTLEIVPNQHPYANLSDKPFSVKILFKGEALANAQVELSSLNANDVKAQTVITDKNGLAHFDFEQKGKWLFNVVWAVPISQDDRAEFETFFASMTVGYSTRAL